MDVAGGDTHAENFGFLYVHASLRYNPECSRSTITLACMFDAHTHALAHTHSLHTHARTHTFTKHTRTHAHTHTHTHTHTHEKWILTSHRCQRTGPVAQGWRRTALRRRACSFASGDWVAERRSRKESDVVACRITAVSGMYALAQRHKGSYLRILSRVASAIPY